jgi:hypothetical protein
MERSAASQESHIFLDKTALQDTGQYGWQRFRKPLLYVAQQSNTAAKQFPATHVDIQLSCSPLPYL